MAGPSNSEPDAGSASAQGTVNAWTWASLVVALAALTGSLWLSQAMGLKACPLCFYQRTFVMSLVAVLGIGLFAGLARTGKLGLLAIPLATAGLGVALFHVSLEMRNKLECPPGIFGVGTAPQQSLTLFVLLFALLAMDVATKLKAGGMPVPALIGGLVLGALLAVASCTSNPPMPAPPNEPYAKEPDICRPPFPAQ